MKTQRSSPWFALIVLSAIATVGFIDRIIVNVLVEPVKAEFDLTDLQVSLMAWAFAALNISAGLVVARIAERVRRLTLLSVGTIIWSIATALCGTAGSWVQLLVARMGVGLGEAIGLPGNQSVIADYFPANKRGLAMSVLLLSPPLGAFFGFLGGGWVAQEFGWRMTFLVAAVPGLVLGFVAWVFVAEPKRGQHDPDASEDVPPISAVFARLFGLPSARNLVAGSALASMLGFGLVFFFASLMVRKFGLGLAEAGLYAGITASLPAAVSVIGSGWLGDRLGQRNPAAYALIPAFAMLVGGPLYAFAILRDELDLLLVLVSFATFCNFAYLGITYASLQNLMHPRMRATASATLTGIYGIAGALGPSLLGWMSDRLAQDYGPAEGLALAMASCGAVYLWASAHYFLAARHLRADGEAVREVSA